MAFFFSQASLNKLDGVHPDLVSVVRRALALTKMDFCVLQGLRTLAQEEEYVKEGKSTTMHSRHLTGHAVDLGATPDEQLSWENSYYFILADTMKQAANDLNIPIEWGGDWVSFKDLDHFQLPWADYPAEQPTE